MAKSFKTTRHSRCASCGTQIDVGEEVMWSGPIGSEHVKCFYRRLKAEANSEKAEERARHAELEQLRAKRRERELAALRNR